MKNNLCFLSLALLATNLYSASTSAQLLNYETYYQQSNFNVIKEEDLVYGIGATNYYLYAGSGAQNDRSNYDWIREKELTLDLFLPDTSNQSGNRAVLILIPGSGREGCLNDGECTVRTIKRNDISTSTAQYLSQEGDNYNELNDNGNRAVNFARRGFVVVSPNTRYRYHNKQYDDANANRWFRDDGTDLFNGSSTHLEPLVVDVRRIVRWLADPIIANQYGIDTKNIFILGSSGAAKIASLAAITPNDKLLADDPNYLNSSNSNYQFEVDNNHLLNAQPILRGAILISGDTNGTRNLELMDDSVGDFLFWHGTKDRSIFHGMAETIEEKCELVGCQAQFYSLPGIGHGNAASAEYVYSNDRPTATFSAHVYDFMINVLETGSIDNRPVLSINSDNTVFTEQSGVAEVELTLSEPLSTDLEVIVSADNMREVTLEDGDDGQYAYVEQFVANDSNSTGPIMYDQGTGVVFEQESNLPSGLRDLTVHESGPGEGNPVLLDPNSDYFFNDFHGFQQVVTIPSGQTSLTVNVAIVNDTVHEQNECFKFRLLHAHGVKIVNSIETITILDNDNPNAGAMIPVVCANPSGAGASNDPVLSLEDKFVNETSGTAYIKLLLDKPSSQAITVNYTTLDISANQPEDYQSQQQQITINAGQTQVFIPVEIIDDLIVEDDEAFFIEIQQVVSGAASIGQQRATVTIIDDDGGTIELPNLSIERKLVNEASGIAYIKILSDQLLSEDVVFSYTTVDGQAVAGADYETAQGQVTMRAGNQSVFIPVTILEDSQFEGDQDFTFELLSIDSNNANIGAAQQLVTIIDNDLASAVRVSIEPKYVSESSDLAYIKLITDRVSSEPIVLSYDLLPGSASHTDGDYVNTQGQVTIAASRQEVFVPVDINDDSFVEGNEEFIFRLVDVVSGEATIAAPQQAVTIVDND